MHAKLLQSYPTLCDHIDCRWPGFSIRGTLQARMLELVAMPFSKGSSQPRDWTQISCIGRPVFYLSHQGSRLRVEGWKNTFHTNEKDKKTRIAIRQNRHIRRNRLLTRLFKLKYSGYTILCKLPMYPIVIQKF